MLYRHLEVVISFYLIFKIKAVFNHNCAQSLIKMTHSDAKKTSFENSDKASNGNPGFLNLPSEILWNSIFSPNDTKPVFSLKIVPYNTFSTSSWFKPLFLLSIYIPPNICRTSHKNKQAEGHAQCSLISLSTYPPIKNNKCTDRQIGITVIPLTTGWLQR